MANYTSVTASNICDAAGNKLASGTVSFQATDAANQPLNFQVGGGGQVVTTPATAAIVAGAIAGGFQVADSANTSPAGILYRITITDTTLNRVVVTYSLVTVTGTTFSLDNFSQIGAAVLPPVGGSVNGPLTVTGNLTVTGQVNNLQAAGLTVITGSVLAVVDPVSGACTVGGPAIDASAWAISTLRCAVTEASSNSNRFTSTFQFQANNSSTNIGNIEKGAAFFRVLHNDTTATSTPNLVAFDALGQIVAGNTQGNVWGGVCRTQVDATGDGWTIGLEIDVTNNGTNVNAHQDAGAPKAKTGLWLASFGSQPASWMIDSISTGPGWNNGISIRKIVAGGIGLELPNNIGLYWRNAANNADIKILNVDGANNVILNTAAGAFFQVNGSGVGSYSSSGFVFSAGVALAAGAPTVSAGQVGLGSTTATTATAGANGAVPAQVDSYLIVNVGGTTKKIPLFAA